MKGAVTLGERYPVRKVCRILGITLSAYYHRKRYKAKPKYTEEEERAVKEMYHRHMGNFGRRTLRQELMKEEVIISEKRISGIMKKLGLRSKYGRRKTKNLHTHEKTAEKYIHENLYKKLSEEEKRLEIWSMDFTEKKVKGKTIYTCGIQSVSRKILIARITGEKNDAATAVKTMMQGIERYGKPYMVMTDRGAPFTSKSFKETVERYGILHSMSRPHTPVDNIYIETFWKTMKTEIGEVEHLTEEEYYLIMDYYEYYYNFLRPHSSLGYCPPVPHAYNSVI